MTPREFAVRAHGEQRYGDQPYSVHLDAVAALAGPEHEAIAYLHDVLEDTDASAEEIERLFGAEVRRAVELLTDPGAPSRGERKRLLHERLRAAGPDLNPALVVKAADRLANLRACTADNPRLLAMYRVEHEAFREAAFRPGLCDALWDEMRDLLTRG